MLTNLNNLHRPCWPRNRVCLCQAVSIPHMGREPFSNHFHNVSSPNPPWNVYIGIGCPRLQKSRFVRLSPFPACNTQHYYRGSKRALLRLSLQRAWPCARAWIHRELYWKSKVQVARSRVVKQFVEKTPLRVRAGVRQNLTPSLTALSTFPYRHHWHDTIPIRRHHNQHDVWSESWV